MKSRPKLHIEWIDRDALDIVKRLQKDGYTSFLVGGCVRDLLAGIPPKDFDIATNALPQQVRRNIYNSFIIGKRFRLVLVKRDNKQFEVATFRKEYDPQDFPEGEEPPQGDNVFGAPEDDAKRRDFTVNALFYDPIKNEIIDFCEGLKDVEARMIRMIGDPVARLVEDPIRILRALRLAHKLRFTLEPSLRAAMTSQACELAKSVLPRRREELLKILRLPDPFLALQEAHDLGLLKYVSAGLDEVFQHPEKATVFAGYIHRLHHFVDDPSSPVELFAVLALAYVRSILQPDPFKKVSAAEIMENQALNTMFKMEWGLFNYEQKIIAKALHLQTDLLKTEEYSKKKETQKADVVCGESFGVSLLMAYADHLISPAQLHFWKTEQDKHQKLMRASRPHHRPFRRQKRKPQQIN